MKTEECNGGFQPAGWRLRDGRLLFPTMHGVSFVDPKRMTTQPVPPRAVIEKLVVNNSSVAVKTSIGQSAGAYYTNVPSGKYRFHVVACARQLALHTRN